MKRPKSSLLFLIAVPLACTLLPALIWLASRSQDGKVALGAMMLSLAATARVALRVLDRRGIDGMWSRLGWVIVAAMVGIIAWGVILRVGDASFAQNELR